MKITGKSTYSEAVSGLRAMMHQTIMVHLKDFRENGEAYNNSTFMGVMSAFEVKESKKSESLYFTIFCDSKKDGTYSFSLDEFEIEHIPDPSLVTF